MLNKKRSGISCLISFIFIVKLSPLYSEKGVSVKSYSPVEIISCSVSGIDGKYKTCLIDAEFKNTFDHGIWIIINEPADAMIKRGPLFRGEGPVSFCYSSGTEGVSESGKAAAVRRIKVAGGDGTGFTAYFLDAGSRARVSGLQARVLRFPAQMGVITAKELRINRGISMIKWMSGLQKEDKAAVESIIITTEDLKRVDAEETGNWIYLLNSK